MSELEATGGEGTLIAPEPATTSAWYGEEFAETVEQKGWKEPTDVLKSYTELEKTFSGRVKMPTPESSAEEIRAFYQKTGCPENPDGYEIPNIEGAEAFRDEATEKELAGIAHEMGVSKQAFEAIVGKYYDHMATQMVKSREASESALKEEFGDKYEEQLTVAQRFAQSRSPEFMELMETTGLGNNPVIIKEFIDMGKATMADTLIKGNVANSDEAGYVPYYKDSPEMYQSGEDEESKKARAWFEAKGHKY
jgi:hypothetical protein